jgi:hypothetical protein
VNGLYTLAAMGAVVLVAAVIIFAAIRAAGRAGVAEANADAAKRQTEALKADIRRSDAIEKAADAARSAPAGDQPLAERLRASGRGRKTRP